jgi:hypothetical protein
MWKRFAAIALVTSALSACSVGTDLPLAQAAIVTFHQHLNAGDYASIYVNSSVDMKTASTQVDLVKLLDAIHRKLGAYQSGTTTNWRDNLTTGGHFVSIMVTAKYDNGSADEAFDYRIDGNKALLAGYHVTSNAMLEN